MAQGIVAQRVEDILHALKMSGVDLAKATQIEITYKEMGEYSGALVVPEIVVLFEKQGERDECGR